MPTPPHLAHLIGKITRSGEAGRIAARYDAAALSQSIGQSAVSGTEDFYRLTVFFLRHVLQYAEGAAMDESTARGRVRRLLEEQGRRTGATFESHIRNAIDGQNGGLRKVLDALLEAARDERVSEYVRTEIDRHVDPLSFDQKEAAVEEAMTLFRQMGMQDGLHDPRAKAHAADYVGVISDLQHAVDGIVNRLRRN